MPAAGRCRPDQVAHQRALAGAAAAHDHEHVAAADREGEVLHQRPAAERHGQVLDLDVRRPLRGRSRAGQMPSA